MISREALARILAVIVLLALAPTLVVLYTHIDSNQGEQQAYRNWTADDPLPSLANVTTDYVLIKLADNVTSYTISNSTVYYYYVIVYNNNNVVGYVLAHVTQYDFNNSTVLQYALTGSVYNASLTKIYASLSTTPQTIPSEIRTGNALYIDGFNGANRKFDLGTTTNLTIYAVYPKVSGSSNTSIVGALLPVFLLAVAAAVLSKLGL